MEIFDESGVAIGRVGLNGFSRPAGIVEDTEFLFRVLSPAFHARLSSLLGYVQRIEEERDARSAALTDETV